jgi:hypothetical protein
MYYGNPSANSASNLEATMLFADDFTGGFDWSKWDVYEYTNHYHYFQTTSSGELKVYAESTSKNSGYEFRSKTSISETYFMIHAKSRWINLDYIRGGSYAGFLGLHVYDSNGDRTGEGVGLRGDYKVYLNRYRDGSRSGANPPDYSSGQANFLLRKEGAWWTIDLSGTYSHTWTGSLSTATSPYTIVLSAYLDYWTNKVSVTSYYDYVFVRKYIYPEPTHGSWGYEENQEGIHYIDVMVVADLGAQWWASLYGHYFDYLDFYRDQVEIALDFGYKQYFSDVEFVTNNFYPWVIYDPDGHGYSSNGDILDYWPRDLTQDWLYPWPIQVSHNLSWTRKGANLPLGQGHGGFFDLCVMFTYLAGQPFIGGFAWKRHNVIVINVGLIGLEPYTWNIGIPGLPFIGGLYSIILHESGHTFGLSDYNGERFDVMDYYYGVCTPYSHSFDEDHQNDIEAVRHYHSA